ncbi:hypothetical protein MTP03_01150 [Tsukamurella sp. PLM1]|nr:hypothetical protein MTP03_01150 [Tsukamurella sp. PLM1]
MGPAHGHQSPATVTATASPVTVRDSALSSGHASARSQPPKPKNRTVAPMAIARSGSFEPRSAPMAIASASAATMPAVEPIQTPNQSCWVVRVIVASIVLSPSSDRKNADVTARNTDRVTRSAVADSSSDRVSPRHVQNANTSIETPATAVMRWVGIAEPSA